MDKKPLDPLIFRFSDLFNTAPELVVNSPGRANIIGEHTDYNEGLVLPFAIDRLCYFIAKRQTDRVVSIAALDLNKKISLNLESLPKEAPKDWTRYFITALKVLQKYDYPITGIQCVFSSEVPIGAGLSSSSAITCGFIAVFNAFFQLNIPKERQIRLASEAENGTGVQGGMMDQYAIVMAKKEHALLLDCKDFSTELVPNTIEGCHWYFIDTQVQHNLANTEYNLRRNDCERGFQQLKNEYPSLSSIREITKEQLLFLDKDVVSKKRLRFVIEENARVLAMKDALLTKNPNKVGDLLYEGHLGLSREYEVSCEELDYLVEVAKKIPGIFGTRMMGGGFGGGVIALVKNDSLEAPHQVLEAYQNKYKKGAIYSLNSIEGITTDVLVGG